MKLTRAQLDAIEAEWPHLRQVHYHGVYWRDIDWDKPIHRPLRCVRCGADAAEGHLNACEYLFKNQTSPAGREFLRDSIRRALEREDKQIKYCG